MDEGSQQIIMWVGGVLITVIGALISALSVVCWNAVKDLRVKYSEAVKNFNTKLEEERKERQEKHDKAVRESSERAKHIYTKLEEERKERQEKHDKAVERLFVRIEELQTAMQNSISQVKEDMGDVRETVAGFGSVYVTRKEWIEGCPQKPRHPNGGG